jgi:OOP family OmpA-OmpF porin
MRRNVCGALAASALFASVSTARAQGAGFSVNHFDPSERGSEWFALDSLDLRGHGRLALGVVADWAYRPLVATDANGSFVRSIILDQVVVHPGGSVVLWSRLRLGVDLPVQVFADGHTVVLGGTTYAAPANTTSLGDLRLGGDVRLFGEYGQAATAAFGLDVYVPTGDQASYASDGSARVAPHVLLAGDVGPFVYALKLGVMIRTLDTTFGPSHVGSDLSFGASAGLRVANKKLVIGPEVFGDSVVTGGVFFSERATPLEGMFGAHYLIGDQVRVGAGISTGLTGGYGTPQRRGVVVLEWAPGVRPPDRDFDGIIDADDACPDVPGIRTDDPSTNGCPLPAPSDRDQDGILDADDACPDVKGVRTGDPKTNGCPPDRDHDGVLDPDDACPDDPGVATSDPKTNGCPPDRDNDGVFDRDDACPDVPGLHTSDPKTNGCPDPDRDKDGIPNEQDACPDEPGKPDPDPKRNGCPKAYVQDGQIKILDQVKFKTGSAEILPGPESKDVLDAVLAVLGAHPEIKKVRVEGHTDNRGAAKMNQKLSAARAASVMQWLVGRGVPVERLESAGFGLDRPIDSNLTEAGRKNNRRVEFHIEP